MFAGDRREFVERCNCIREAIADGKAHERTRRSTLCHADRRLSRSGKVSVRVSDRVDQSEPANGRRWLRSATT